MSPKAMTIIGKHSESTILDAFCNVLQSKLKYKPDERDMVCMHNIFGYITETGQKVVIIEY